MVYHVIAGQGVKSCWWHTVCARRCVNGSALLVTVSVMTGPTPGGCRFLPGVRSSSPCRRRRRDYPSSSTVTRSTSYRVPVNTRYHVHRGPRRCGKSWTRCAISFAERSWLLSFRMMRGLGRLSVMCLLNQCKPNLPFKKGCIDETTIGLCVH